LGLRGLKKFGEFTIAFLQMTEHHHLLLYNREILVAANTNELHSGNIAFGGHRKRYVCLPTRRQEG